MTYNTVHKVLAALAFKRFPDQITRAAAAFTADCKLMGLKAPQDARHFVQKRGTAWSDLGSVDGAARNSGRKPVLSTTDAEVLAHELLSWPKLGLKGPYKSIKELKKHSQVAQEIIKRAGVKEKAIIRAVRKVEPRFTYKLLTVKPKLTPTHKANRLRVALAHLAEPMSTLKRVVWIDAKTMYLNIKTRRGWVLVDEEYPFETNRSASKKNPTQLRYYIAVNHKVGAAFITFVTGTTGMPATSSTGQPYLVRLALVQLGWLSCLHSSNSTLDGLTPALCTAAHGTRVQPHHVVADVDGSLCQSHVPLLLISQAAALVVCSSVHLAAMLLALHLNQNLARLQQHHVPLVFSNMHHPTLILNFASHSTSLHSKGHNFLHFVQQPVALPLE